MNESAEFLESVSGAMIETDDTSERASPNIYH